MNLQPLFETQKKLMDRIGYNEPDRFEKTILALLVEVGECANEWRGFKYWSKNQEPVTEKLDVKQIHKVRNKEIKSVDELFKNPLLEEYVDGLHFVLQLGIEFGVKSDVRFRPQKVGSLIEQFNLIFHHASNYRYIKLFDYYCGLGEMLGFTWEQIQQAYMEKNKINHERQNNGY